jgi:hypothetical protein
MVWDDNIGEERISSAAFDDDKDGPMSVFIGEECGGTAAVLENHDGYGLAFITALLARDCGQRLVRTPSPPGHVHVIGKKTDGMRKRFARFASDHWIVRPS